MFKNHHRFGHRVFQTAAMVGALAGLAWGSQTVAHASTLAVPDISEWQGRLSAGEVAGLKNQVSFVINRRQYGAGYQDLYATNNTNLYVRYGVPFGEYDYARFHNAASARQEAQDFYARSNKHVNFYVLDFEENDVTSGSTNAAVRAWADEMRSLTTKHLVFYSYQSFATTYANSARKAFDAQWIANYSSTPTIPFALWQYTDHNYLSALGQYTDNSRVATSVHPVSWWADSAALALTHAPATSSATTSPTNTNVNPTVAAPSTSGTGATFTGYPVGAYAELHKHATRYTDGKAIPVSRRQRLYKITKVSGQKLYLKTLHHWVWARDVTGYWGGQYRSFKLTHKLNLYRNASLTRRTGSYYVTGDTVYGSLVKAPNGRAYRIKTKLGYLTANVRYSNLA